MSAAVLGRRIGELFTASASRIAIIALCLAPGGADAGRETRAAASPEGRERPPKSRLENIVDVEVQAARGRHKLVQPPREFPAHARSDRETFISSTTRTGADGPTYLDMSHREASILSKKFIPVIQTLTYRSQTVYSQVPESILLRL